MSDDEAALRGHSASNHASYRGLAVLAGTLATVLVVCLIAAHPAVAHVTGVGPFDVLLVCGLFAGVSVAAALAHRRAGYDSRAYQVLNFGETVMTVLGSLWLVYRGGSAVSVFWVFYFAVLFHAATFAANTRANTLLFSGGPAALALAFFAQGDPVGATLTLMLTVVAVVGYRIGLSATRRTAELAEGRRRLLEQERELSVLRERARIERDLHDGLGAELTGLVYRAQGLGPSDAERDELAQRLRDVLGELRTVVWMLRRDQRTAGELVAWLRTRCLDLATGALKVSFEVDVDDARVVPGEVGMHVVHVVLEAVRNASRHALAKSVAVRVGLRGEVVVSVRDDGRGLPEGALEATAGGLANLRARASSLGGSLEVGSDAQGTTVTLRCPWPVTPTSADMR